MHIELGGTTAGTEYDHLAISGEAALNGTVHVTLIDGFTPAAGDAFNIVTYGSWTGAPTVELPEIGPLDWQVDFTDDNLELRVVESGG